MEERKSFTAIDSIQFKHLLDNVIILHISHLKHQESYTSSQFCVTVAAFQFLLLLCSGDIAPFSDSYTFQTKTYFLLDLFCLL